VGDIDENMLIDQAIRFGFVNVIDAFHVVNQAPTSIRFLMASGKKIKEYG